MIRALLAAVTLSLLAGSGDAAEPAVHLTVRPMAAPNPALKYLFLPEVREQIAGNPAHEYLRCFAEHRFFFFAKEGVAERTRFLTLSLDELAKEKNRNYGGNALRRADDAARMNALDWQALRSIQTEGTDLLLPELGPLRVLADALQARFRLEVASKRFDDALRSAKTLFALARHLGEHPAGAANLLGLTIARRTLTALEEMEQQPGCPNLYWALTDLPAPLVDLHPGFQGDCSLVDTDLKLIRRDVSMTGEQIEEAVSRLSGRAAFLREQAGRPPRSLRTVLKARVDDPDKVRAARARLVAAGYAADTVGQCAAMQAILLDEKREYECCRDFVLKLYRLPLWQIDRAADKVGTNTQETLLADLIPPVIEGRHEQGRVQQRIAMARLVEALRLHAAGHDGQLPADLNELGVPVPDDPDSGKPFIYQLEGASAHLRSKAPGHDIHYVVTIRK